MKIASWNVNSIKVRLPRLLAYLERERPDVLCLQEIKTTEDKFPHDAIRAAGYHVACLGQKTYNGVAILSRDPPADCVLQMQDSVEDPQARLIGVTLRGVRVLSAYVPNGFAVGSDKWEYKLAWFKRLKDFLGSRYQPAQPLAVCGDFNVAPDERDVHDVKLWEETVLCHPTIRQTLRDVMAWGLVDTFRLHDQRAGQYSWWDYRAGAFHRNWGLRIDLILATSPLAGKCAAAAIDRDERKGEQPSDHAPISATFEV